MSEALAVLTEEEFTVAVRGERTIILPPGTWRQVIGRSGQPPKVFKILERVELPGEVIDPGTYFWSNVDQGLYAQADGPHMAELAMAHTNSGYGYNVDTNDVGELHWLEMFFTTVQDGVFMLANWRGMSGDAKERLGRRIAGVVDVPGMHAPRNEHKIRMRWRAGTSVGMRDRLQRPNPGATSAKLAAAGNDAQRRRMEVMWIARYIDGRRVGVRQEMTSNMSVVRQVHLELQNLLADNVWYVNESKHVDRIDRIIGRMRMIVDAPWRQAFRRTIEDDLEYAKRYAGKMEGHKYGERALIEMELLELYAELADLDLRLAITLDHHPRQPKRRELRSQKLAGLKAELEVQIRDLPVRFLKGEPKPGFDKDFRAPVTPKLYHRLSHANAAWVREDWAEVKYHIRDALAAFG